MLMQPLKLQLKACIIPYLFNVVLSCLAIVLMFLLKAPLEFIVILFSIQLIYSFFYGLFNYTTLGKTYSSLKHDKHNFAISSLIMNIINALIMALSYLLAIILDKANIRIIELLSIFSIHMLVFSIGSFYSLFLAKHKILNIVLLILISTSLFIFGIYIIKGLQKGLYFMLDKNNVITMIIVVIALAIAITSLNIINSIKYKKQ